MTVYRLYAYARDDDSNQNSRFNLRGYFQSLELHPAHKLYTIESLCSHEAYEEDIKKCDTVN